MNIDKKIYLDAKKRLKKMSKIQRKEKKRLRELKSQTQEYKTLASKITTRSRYLNLLHLIIDRLSKKERLPDRTKV